MTHNFPSPGAAVETFAKPLTFESIPADARLTRRHAAKALSACGVPLSAKTLATKASRGGGPAYQLFGKIAIYTWGTLVAWALEQMGEPAANSSHRKLSLTYEKPGRAYNAIRANGEF